MIVGTAVPIMLVGTKISLAAVPTTLAGTAVTTINVGTTVPTTIARNKNFFCGLSLQLLLKHLVLKMLLEQHFILIP